MNAIFPNSLGFNIVLYGLGSKRDLLERFRATMLQDSIHIVINGFFPGISVKSVSFKNVKRNHIISPANLYLHVNEVATSHSGVFSFVFRLPTSRIAYCLIKVMSLESEGSSFESPSLNFLLRN